MNKLPDFRTLLLLACCSCLFTGLFGQTKLPKLSHTCNFIGDEPQNPQKGYDPAVEINAFIDSILTVSGLSRRDIILKSASVDNALASFSEGKKYILYNISYLEGISKKHLEDRWEVIGVLAHEIGHLANGDIFENAPEAKRINMELDADRFAGSVLKALGAELDEAERAYAIIPEGGSKTHPPRRERLAALADGWVKRATTAKVVPLNYKSTAKENHADNVQATISKRSMVITFRLKDNLLHQPYKVCLVSKIPNVQPVYVSGSLGIQSSGKTGHIIWKFKEQGLEAKDVTLPDDLGILAVIPADIPVLKPKSHFAWTVGAGIGSALVGVAGTLIKNKGWSTWRTYAYDRNPNSDTFIGRSRAQTKKDADLDHGAGLAMEYVGYAGAAYCIWHFIDKNNGNRKARALQCAVEPPLLKPNFQVEPIWITETGPGMGIRLRF